MSSMKFTVDQYNELLYVGFNQDYGCVACGTDSGFRIFNVEPFRETYRRVFSSGGIGIVEMLFRCNLVALVGGGRNPRYPPHKIALNRDSTCVATASDKGTLIRIFDVLSGTLLHELRRGMDRADITSIAFNANSLFLACCSDRGTAHVFSLATTNQEHYNIRDRKGRMNTDGERMNGVQQNVASGDVPSSQQQNQRSGLSFLSGIIPAVPRYFTSMWSFAQLRGLETPSICAFGMDPHTLIIVSADGSFMTAKFSESGEMERTSYARFITEPGVTGPSRITTPLGGASTTPATPTVISRVHVEEEAKPADYDQPTKFKGGGVSPPP
eukprot:27318_1